MIYWLQVLALVGFPLGMILGYWLGTHFKAPPSDEYLADYMGRVVNQEEMEEHIRLSRYRMARNGVKTQRFDGGPNARVMRVRIRPTSKRFRK